MIQDNTNYTLGSWGGLMQGLKLPRRTAVAALIVRLLQEASPADVEEATPTEEAAIRKASCSLSPLPRRIEGHSVSLTT
ncbi:hypothetical protein B484DRAFT_408937 [Ochromonadaceae sp. CCMP2298]|nr:hypothetical protein B484DRAFT_408937 [Ochromonadaceae sp. CCMP2298]